LHIHSTSVARAEAALVNVSFADVCRDTLWYPLAI